jgi:peptidoglycan/LPS O-acetylase OafA/YrhL
MATLVERTQSVRAAERNGTFDFRRRVLALDGLRGVAILAVFLYHYGNGGNQSSNAMVRAVSKVFGLGWSGVDLFFVLSGFLITGILFDTQLDPGYYKKFYIRRILRIFPIYYVAAAAVFFVGLVVGVHWSGGHLSFLFYLGYPAAALWPSLVQVSPLIRITHLWSLSVEEQFYMIWPWLIRLMGGMRRILLVCLAMFVVALASRLAFVEWVNPVWAYVFLPCRMDDLAVGAAIAIAVRGGGAEKLRRWALPALVFSTASFVALCIIRHTVDHSDAAIAVWGYSLIAIAYGALLVMSLGRLSTMFSWSIFRVFGRYSYGLYLYHFPLTVLLEPMRPWIIARTGSFAIGSVAYVVVCVTINLSLAALSFQLIESPIMHLKSHFSYERVPEAPRRLSITTGID